MAFLRPRFGAHCMASVSTPYTARAQTKVSWLRRNAGQLLSANHTDAELTISGTSIGAYRASHAYIGALSDFTWSHATTHGDSR